MAHYAKLDNNNVVAVHVVNNSVIDPANEEQSGADYLNDLYGIDAVWKQTSYNGKIRFNYAGIGYTYDEVRDGFIPPKCHDEAVVNDECLWDCTNADHDPLVK
jgi:hypothetical protein